MRLARRWETNSAQTKVAKPALPLYGFSNNYNFIGLEDALRNLICLLYVGAGVKTKLKKCRHT